jgi:hypothetical protein
MLLINNRNPGPENCEKFYLYSYMITPINVSICCSSEWQREMEKETTRGDHQRTTQMQMASVPYSPPPDDRPRRRKRPNGKRNLLGLMSVGPLLRQARNQYGNEEGEVDNDDCTCLGGTNV